MNQYFPNGQCSDVTNYEQVKDPFKVQDKLMRFNITKWEKLTDKVADSTLQVSIQETTTFPVVISMKKGHPQVSEKAIKILLREPSTISVRLDFLHVLQPKQHIIKD